MTNLSDYIGQNYGVEEAPDDGWSYARNSFNWDSTPVFLGPVGVGTKTPSTLFHVNAGDTTVPALGAADKVLVQGAVGANIYLSLAADDAKKSGIRFGNSTQIAQGQISYDNAGDYMAFNTVGATAMRITSDGYLAIGTTVASYPLVVSRGGNNGFEFDVNGTDHNRILNYDRTTAQRIYCVYDALYHAWHTDNDAEKMRLTNAGNLGIGITGPTYKLEVNGDVNLSGAYNYYINGVPIETFVDAPADGQTYGRNNNAWVLVSGGGGTISNLAAVPTTDYVDITNTGGDDARVLGASVSQAGVMTTALVSQLNSALQSGDVDLANTRNSTSVTITNTAGNNTTISAATTSLAGVMTAADKSKLNDVPTDFPAINPGTSYGQTLIWDDPEWVPTSIFKQVSSVRIELNYGTASSTWPTAIGTNTKVQGAFEATGDISCVDVFSTGDITCNGAIAADTFLRSANLAGSGNVNIYADNGGNIVPGTPLAEFAYKSDLLTLVSALESEGVITPAAAATLTAAFTP